MDEWAADGAETNRGRRAVARTAASRQGPGITTEDRLRVFDRFHRGAESPGTGLGLAIARQVVESHDGRLLLTDTPGPGSTFVIWLPGRAIAGAPERGPEPPVGDPTQSPAHWSGATVLAEAGPSLVRVAAQDARNRSPSSDALPGTAL